MEEKPEAIIITIPMRIFDEKQGGEPAQAIWRPAKKMKIVLF